mmetsp:Transcript_499/g.702  ORF Transcript_499/g.702 Transcript_499/m.702 type:complete len:227 (-) Transcript_499:191-871(-)
MAQLEVGVLAAPPAVRHAGQHRLAVFSAFHLAKVALSKTGSVQLVVVLRRQRIRKNGGVTMEVRRLVLPPLLARSSLKSVVVKMAGLVHAVIHAVCKLQPLVVAGGSTVPSLPLFCQKLLPEGVVLTFQISQRNTSANNHHSAVPLLNGMIGCHDRDFTYGRVVREVILDVDFPHQPKVVIETHHGPVSSDDHDNLLSERRGFVRIQKTHRKRYWSSARRHTHPSW